MAITEVEKCVEDWYCRSYGPDVDIPLTYRKLCEEVGEVGAALMESICLDHVEDVREELGDVVMVLLHLVRAICPGASILDLAGESLLKAEDRLARRMHGPVDKQSGDHKIDENKV